MSATNAHLKVALTAVFFIASQSKADEQLTAKLLEERAVKWLNETQVAAPPESLKLDPFYKKHVSALGIPVVSSEHALDAALLEIGYLTQMMLGNRPDVVQAMQRNGTRLAVIAASEFTTDLPEFADMEPKNYWDRRSRGMGAQPHRPVMTIGEENLVGLDGDPYSKEGIFVHEFAHAIHDMGLAYLDPNFNQRLDEVFTSAKQHGWWKGKYAMINKHEYWAEGVQSYFGTNREFDHDHNHVNSRHELAEYDPPLFALVEQTFGPVEWNYTPPKSRSELPHFIKLDRATLPKFKWPERLAEEGRKLDVVRKQQLIEAGEIAAPTAGSSK